MDIVGIVAIIGLVVVICVKESYHYKEKQDLLKMSKVKEVQDIQYVFGKDENDENNIDDESDLIPLESMTQADLDKMREK